MGVVAKGDLLPLLAMVVVQLVYAGMNMTSKLALDSGMKPLILVAYRQLFATLAMLPLAYFFEWKTLPKITKSLLVKLFICSLVGATGNQILFYVGLQNTTPTIGCALANMLPAITFILAVVFRQESVGIKKLSGQAKVLGTILCVGGAMLLSFYHGHVINIGQSSIDWKFADQMEDQVADHKSNHFLGSLLIMASSVSWACWFVLQARVSRDFPATNTSTLLICSFGSIECMVIGISAHHKLAEDWSLRSPNRLVTVLYAGLVSTGIGYSLTCWTIRRKGALYVSVFNPLLLVIVIVLSWALLREKLYVGSVIGSLLIVAGLYGVLWGKNREAKVLMTTIEVEEKEDTTELADQKEDL